MVIQKCLIEKEKHKKYIKRWRNGVVSGEMTTNEVKN